MPFPNDPLKQGVTETKPSYTKEGLEAMTVEQLKNIAKDNNIVGYSSMLKADLVNAILAL